MKVVQFRTEYYQAVGLLEGKRVLDFTRGYLMYCAAEDLPTSPAAHSILGMLQAELFSLELFERVREFIAEHALEPILRVDGARLLAPIQHPPRIIALGLNYAAHAEETGKKPPKEPIFFLKASTAVIGPDQPVVCPPRVGRIDPEVELALVIGKGGRCISRARAVDHIAGYTILNDVTARDMQSRDLAASRPWFLSKSFDTFAPLGPCLVLSDEIETPCELDLKLRVNGKVRQRSNTRDLIFDPPDLIRRLSRYVTLQPGDIISTGTPSGIAPIEPGDVMEAEVERIGILKNPVVAEA